MKKQYIVRDNNTGARYSVTEDEIESEINPRQEQQQAQVKTRAELIKEADKLMHGTTPTPAPKPKPRNEILAFKKAIEESRNYR